ncbi:MAG: AmmeMemoRadiSam system protein B [Desulfovibrio sp.]|nr:AmmeMemoRadiSam system protein B [Desulfovibrio sp.]
MVVREPVAIGRFYPQNREQVEAALASYRQTGPEKYPLAPVQEAAWALLLPHAGYVYCGNVIAATLAGIELADILLIFCPNHTGRGRALSVWPDGVWKTPLGDVPVATELCLQLTGQHSFTADYAAHEGEHAIEVLLPFLCAARKTFPSIVPVCVGTQDAVFLKQAGSELASFLQGLEARNLSYHVIISSDMNHFENHTVCLAKDELALEKIAAADSDGLLHVCRESSITMCGVAPCALVMNAASHMGTLHSQLVAHTSSAEASGNFRQTVGYAGLRFYLERQ